MSIRDCITRAADAKELDRDQAKRLTDLYDEMSEELHFAGLPVDEGALALRMQETITAENALRRRRALLQVSATDRLKIAIQAGLERGHSMGHVARALFENFREVPFQSVVERQKAIAGLARAEMHELMTRFSRDWKTGFTPNRAELGDVVRELSGDATGSATAKAIADTFRTVAETLRQRFNAAGGAIAKLEGWAIPHKHDAAALYRAGKDEWIRTIDPLLDRNAMVHPLTKQPFSDKSWNEFLGRVWERIVTNGDVDLKPGGQMGHGALASRHADHRVLKFKDAEGWMTYDAAFGQGNAFAAMLEYVGSMSRDIALLEALGPNPASTVRWLKDLIAQDRAKRTPDGGGRDAKKFNPFSREEEKLLDDLFADVSGSAFATVNPRTSAMWGAARNFISSAKLGGAVLSTPPDFANQAIARQFLGMSTTTAWGKAITDTVDAMRGATADQSLRAGLAFDRVATVMHRESSWLSSGDAPMWSNWLADRTLTLSGLIGLTRAQREGFGLGVLNAIDELRVHDWHDLDQHAPGIRKAFTDYGLGQHEWSVIRKVDTGGGLLSPRGIAEIDRAAGERVLGMIAQETEFATMQRVHRVQAGENMLNWNLNGNRGTTSGELIKSMSQLKSYTLSVQMLQGLRYGQIVAETGSRFRGGQYLTGWIVAVTTLGALGLQMKEVARGRDPRSMADVSFWAEAVFQGGGMGILGDFVRSETNRVGDGLAPALAGPLVSDASALWDATVTQGVNWWQGKNVNPGKAWRKVVSGNTPIVPFYLRTAYERLVLDNLQRLVDPQADKAFRAERRRTVRERGQDWYWQPGENAPSRAPAFGGE
jgi:hypothetical protein